MLAKIILLAAFLGLASAECPNACSGHGTCGQHDMCTCYANWQGNDCGERTCPSAFAFVTTPQGDLNMDGDRYDNTQKLLVKAVGGSANLGTILENDNTLTLNVAINAGELTTGDAIRFDDTTYTVTNVASTTTYDLDKPADATVTGGNVYKFLQTIPSPKGTWESWAGDYAQGVDEGHYYMECSNQGACDRKTGSCECFDGYTGSACQRQSCNNNCNGHGVCQSVTELSSTEGHKLDITAYSGVYGGRDGAFGAGQGRLSRAASNNLVPSSDPTSELAVGDSIRVGSLSGETLTVTALTTSSITVEPATAGEHLYGSSVYLIPKYELWDASKGRTCVCDAGYTGNDCGLRMCPFGDDPITTHQTNSQLAAGEATVAGGVSDFQQKNEKQNIYLDTARGSLSGSFTLTFTDHFGMAWTTDSIDVNKRLSGKAFVSAAATTTVTFSPSLPYGELTAGDFLIIGDERYEVLTTYPESDPDDKRPQKLGGVVDSVVVANGYTAASSNVYAFRAGPAKGVKAALEALPSGAVPSVTTENMMTGTLLGYPADGVVSAAAETIKEIQLINCQADAGTNFEVSIPTATPGTRSTVTLGRTDTAADVETKIEGLTGINDVSVVMSAATVCDTLANGGGTAAITFNDPSHGVPALHIENGASSALTTNAALSMSTGGGSNLGFTSQTGVAPSTSSLTLLRNINKDFNQGKTVSCTGTATNPDMTCDLDASTDNTDNCPAGCTTNAAALSNGPTSGAPMAYNGGLAPYDLIRVKTAAGKSEFLQVRNVDVFVDGSLEMVAAKGKATASGSSSGYGTSTTSSTPGIGANKGGAMYRAGGYHVRVSFTSNANSGDLPEMEVDESGLYSVFVREFTGTVYSSSAFKVHAHFHGGNNIDVDAAYPFPSRWSSSTSAEGAGATHSFKGDIADLKLMAGMKIKIADQVRTVTTDMVGAADAKGASFTVDAPFTKCEVSETVENTDYIFYRYPVEQLYDSATYSQLTMSRAVFFPRNARMTSTLTDSPAGYGAAILSFATNSQEAVAANQATVLTTKDTGFASNGFAMTGATPEMNYNFATAYNGKGDYAAVFPVGSIMTCTGFTCTSATDCMNRIYAIEGFTQGHGIVSTPPISGSNFVNSETGASGTTVEANGWGSLSTMGSATATGKSAANLFHLKVGVLGTSDTTSACSSHRSEVSKTCFRGAYANNHASYMGVSTTGHGDSEAVCRFHDSMASLASGSGDFGFAPPLHINGKARFATVTDQRPLVWDTPDVDQTALSRIGYSKSRADMRGVTSGGGSSMSFNNDGTALRLSFEGGTIAPAGGVLTQSSSETATINTVTVVSGASITGSTAGTGLEIEVTVGAVNTDVTFKVVNGGTGYTAQALTIAASTIPGQSGAITLTTITAEQLQDGVFRLNKASDADNNNFANFFGYDSDSTGAAGFPDANLFVTMSGCSDTAFNKEYSVTQVYKGYLVVGSDDCSTSGDCSATGDISHPTVNPNSHGNGGICAGDDITLTGRLGSLMDSNSVAIGDRLKVLNTGRHTGMAVSASCAVSAPSTAAAVCTLAGTTDEATIGSMIARRTSEHGHGFATGDFITTGALTTASGTSSELTANTEYVVTRIDASSFSLNLANLGTSGGAVKVATAAIKSTFTKSKMKYETRTVDKIWSDSTTGDVTMFSVADAFVNTRRLQNVEAWVDEAGTTEAAECSSRGICNSEDGVCECFSGYTGNNCGKQNALAEQ
jgi:hypothetical protein